MRSDSLRKHIVLSVTYMLVLLLSVFVYLRIVVDFQVETLEINYLQAFYTFYDHYKIWTYVIPLILLFIRVYAGGTCLFLGRFLSNQNSNERIFDFFKITLNAQWILVLKEVIRVIYFKLSGGLHLKYFFNDYCSLDNILVKRLFRDSVIYPNFSPILSSIDIVQLLYWFVIAWGVSKLFKDKIGKSYLFVLKTYGLGYILVHVCITFIIFLMK